MRRAVIFALVLVAGLMGVPGSGAAPLERQLERAAPVPGTAGSADMAVVGGRLFTLGAAGVLVHDVKDPVQPTLAGRLDLPGRRVADSLQVSPDGRTALVWDFGLVQGDGLLHVVDVRDSTALRLLASVPDWRESPFCLDACRWVYGSSGTVLDLRNPSAPRLAAASRTPSSWVRQAYGRDLAIASVREVRPGLVATAPVKGIFDDRILPLHVLDVREPLRPQVVRTAVSTSDRHSFPDAAWPAGGRSRFQLVQSLFNGEDLFCTSPAPLFVYDVSDPDRVATKPVGQYEPRRGTYLDGSPAANPRLSCGGGRLDVHPGHDAQGGLVLSTQLEHGIRVLRLDPAGRLTEQGWALTPGGSTGLALWAGPRGDERSLFALDDQAGVSVYRYTGPL